MAASKFLIRTCAGLTIAATMSLVGVSTTASAATGPVPSTIILPLDAVSWPGGNVTNLQFGVDVGVLTDVAGSINLLVTPKGTVTFSDSYGFFHVTDTIPTGCLAVPVVDENNCDEVILNVNVPSVPGADEITIAYSGDAVLAPTSETFGQTD